MKSKTMQKASGSNSLLQVYKKALRIFAAVFAFGFIAAYLVSTSLAVIWTFMVVLILLVIL